MAASPNKKTILHVIDSTEPGGAETVFVQLADEFRKRGYRCITVVSGPGWVTDELHRRNFEPVIINAKGAFNISLVRGLVRIVREEKVDLIQSHLLGSNVYCALVGLLTRTPVVATFHGMVDVSPDERLRWLKCLIMKAGVSLFVAVSERLCDEIHRMKLLTRGKTRIIYNGIDMSRYGRDRSSAELRSQLGFDEQDFIIGSLGNVHPAKGYEYLIRAARRVVAHDRRAKFVVAGDAKEHLMEGLRTLMDREGVADCVRFVGFVTDPARFLAQLDLFLLPSISEGFSIATVEAMASGLPIVATKCGGPEEILTDSISARMIRACNEQDIEKALIELMTSESERERLGQRARLDVAHRFGVGAMIDAYEDAYVLAGI